MKQCLREKCGKEFEPKKKKQRYCSTKCRTYAFRERKELSAPEPTEKLKWLVPLATNEAAPKVDYVKKTGKPTNLEELKALCPKELTGFDKSDWIRTERQKYGI
jgi:hypothetical protein